MEMKNFDYSDLVAFDKKEVEIIKEHPLNRKTSEYLFQNKFRKAIFFLFREGLKRLLLKYKSRKIYSQIEKKEIFIIIKSKKDNGYFGGFQYSIDQPIYYFLKGSRKNHLPQIDHYNDGMIVLNPFIGFVLPIQSNSEFKECHDSFKPIILKEDHPDKKAAFDIDLYLVGCGKYVFSEILPIFKEFNQKMAVDFNYEILNLEVFKDFYIRTNDFNTIFDYSDNENKKLAVIASYHSYHTEQAVRFLTLKASKVIIEKPPCVTKDDFIKLLSIYDTKRVYIAYHRRFSKWNILVKKIIARNPTPLIINMVIREPQIPPNHWYFSPNQGTRISGNLCHWIDLAIFWIQRMPVSIKISKNEILGVDHSIYNIVFDDGTIVNLVPTDMGDGTRGVQEYIIIKGKSIDIRIEDYTRMWIWEKGRRKTYFSRIRDKGHRKLNDMYKKFILHGIESPYSKRDFIFTTWIYISFVEIFYSNQDSLELDFSGFLDPDFLAGETDAG